MYVLPCAWIAIEPDILHRAWAMHALHTSIANAFHISAEQALHRTFAKQVLHKMDQSCFSQIVGQSCLHRGRFTHILHTALANQVLKYYVLCTERGSAQWP